MRRASKLLQRGARELATAARPPPRATSKALRTQQATGSSLDADAWKEVRDKASGLTYWWNTRTDETTALGELPGERRANELGGTPGGPPTNVVRTFVELATYGAGVSLAFIAVRLVFGM
jgi:hypothetical protein